MHPEELIAPMEAELIELGFAPLKTAEEVDKQLANDCQGTTLLFINALCGCAGTSARLGVRTAIEASAHKPDQLATVFAGIDDEAAAQVFEYTKPYPPSAPAIALFKDGELVHFIERHQIKGYPAEMLAADLQEALEVHC